MSAGMHERTGLKSNSATNYIQDKDGNIIKNAYSATNNFNEHFCSIHKVFKDPTESLSNIHFNRIEYMTHRKLNSQHFSIPYITCEFVYSQLIYLDISKSTGSDQISAKFKKMAVSIIAPALTQLHNLSISKAEFSSPFKLARVVPIHKKGPKLDYNNYRPILLHLYWNDLHLNGIPRIEFIVLFQTIWLQRTPLLSNCIN